MKELRGDLWELAKGNILCITTNDFLKGKGECVMGRGIAFSAAKKFPNLPKLLENMIQKNGNVVNILGLFDSYILVSFPVKPVFSYDSKTIVKHMKGKFAPGNKIPGWAVQASPAIIQQSITQL